MEANAPALRALDFIRPDWMLLLVRKGAVSLKEPVRVLKILTAAGNLVLWPIIDTNSYRSIYFRFEDDGGNGHYVQ